MTQKTAPAPAWRVVETIAENQNTTSLIIETDAETPTHRPGQFATIRVMREDGWSEPHPFTISCEPSGKRRKFTIKNVGSFTSAVRDLPPGAPIQCSLPYGVFCKDIHDKEYIVMIAGGVGITPFLSVLRAFRQDKAQNRVTLFWANKTLDDAFAAAELEEMTRELALTVVHLISRQPELPPADPSDRIFYEPGRISAALLQKHRAEPIASYYLCGPPAMQDAALAALQDCGVDKDAVQKEAFSFKKG